MAESTSSSAHRAGLFDIRFIIGALVGVYGVILVLTGLIGSDSHVENSSEINLWGGVGMLVVGIVFIAWARLRPIIVPDEPEHESGDRPAGH